MSIWNQRTGVLTRLRAAWAAFRDPKSRNAEIHIHGATIHYLPANGIELPQNVQARVKCICNSVLRSDGVEGGGPQ